VSEEIKIEEIEEEIGDDWEEDDEAPPPLEGGIGNSLIFLCYFSVSQKSAKPRPKEKTKKKSRKF